MAGMRQRHSLLFRWARVFPRLFLATAMILGGSVSLHSPMVAAQDADAEAKALFREGNEAFTSGDYERALERFEAAYAKSPRARLLYNIATTLDRMQRDEETVAALKRYLTVAPDAPERVEVEQRIALIETRIAKRDAEKREEAKRLEALKRAQANQWRGVDPIWSLGVSGVAIALAGAGVVTGVMTLSRNDEYIEYTQSQGAFREPAALRLSRAQLTQDLTNVFLFSAAGVAAISAVLLILTDWAGETQVGVSVDETGAAFSIGGAF